ncbi:MAG: MFS transporter [Firmicutes bacterium]|nr:MFS transporter [Bacillota bacterium]
MKFKMNSLEKKWVLYDVANSAFTLLVATIMPIYFNFISSSAGISDVDYMAYWGYATSAATLIVAFLGPVLGTVSDFKNRKKKFFMLAVLLGAFGCVALGMIQSWLWFILLFIITKSAYSLSLVFYDAMLTDITTEDRMDQVSSNGYAWGYIGSCVPFVLCLVLVLMYDKIGLTLSTAMAIAFALIAIWWFVLTIPLFKSYEQLHYIEEQDHIIKATWSRLATVFKDLKKNRKVFMFLIAFFFYIDGVYTIIDMATAYGSALGFDSTGLLLALLLTQVVAFPAAITFGKLAAKYPNHRLILICITAYLLIALYAIQLDQQYEFWILAFFVGLFQGAIQSLSRSYFARLIPPEKSGEYFGLYDICGKGAAFLGTFIVSFVSQLTNSMNLGVGAIAIMFVLGLYFFNKTRKMAD